MVEKVFYAIFEISLKNNYYYKVHFMKFYHEKYFIYPTSHFSRKKTA